MYIFCGNRNWNENIMAKLLAINVHWARVLETWNNYAKYLIIWWLHDSWLRIIHCHPINHWLPAHIIHSHRDNPPSYFRGMLPTTLVWPWASGWWQNEMTYTNDVIYAGEIHEYRSSSAHPYKFIHEFHIIHRRRAGGGQERQTKLPPIISIHYTGHHHSSQPLLSTTVTRSLRPPSHSVIYWSIYPTNV